MSDKRITAAGFAILKRNHEGEYLIGALLKGKEYDIPKGKMEKGEVPLECAFRELKEEASITNVNMFLGTEHTVVNTLAVYLGITQQNGFVGINPVTGIKEHERFRWLTLREMEMHCLPFLRPVPRWVRSMIK